VGCICRRGETPRLCGAKPACAGESGLFLQRLSDALRPRAPCTGAALLRPSYAPLTVGLKPPALQGEARLRGRERIISSKTIRCAAPPRPLYGRSAAAPLVCASYRRAQAPGSPGRSPPARARADYFFKDHQMRCAPAPPGAALLRPSYAPLTVGLKPPALQGEARLRGLYGFVAVLTDVEPPRTTAITITLPTRRPK
jgi:hypothetical protein